MAVVDAIRHKLPSAHVVRVDIPPREQLPNTKRQQAAEVNRIVRERLSAQRDPLISFVGESYVSDFVDPVNGTISNLDLYDYVHFTDQGFRKFCPPIIAEIKRILDLPILEKANK